jgi:hypothetical protein
VTQTPLTEVLNGASRPEGGGGAQGSIPLPKRSGARTLLPETWLGRSVRVTYLDAFGSGAESTATLLDWCGHGAIMSLSGERTVLAWDALRTVTLTND